MQSAILEGTFVPFRARFWSLRVCDGQLPDPATVWSLAPRRAAGDPATVVARLVTCIGN